MLARARHNLLGKNEDGKFKSSLAETYPLALNRLLFDCFISASALPPVTVGVNDPVGTSEDFSEDDATDAGRVPPDTATGNRRASPRLAARRSNLLNIPPKWLPDHLNTIPEGSQANNASLESHADACVYVDDGFCTADSGNTKAAKDLSQLSKHFKLEVQETIDMFVGMNFTQHSAERVTLTNEAFIMSMVGKFLKKPLADYPSYSTPQQMRSNSLPRTLRPRFSSRMELYALLTWLESTARWWDR